MRNQLDKLSDDSSTQSWKEHPDFSDYREAIKGISELGEVNKGGREFFVQLPATFLKTFIASYRKLVESCWRHWKIVSYVVAGDPTLAHAYFEVACYCRRRPRHGRLLFSKQNNQS